MVIVVYRWLHQSHDIYVVGHIIMYTVYTKLMHIIIILVLSVISKSEGRGMPS